MKKTLGLFSTSDCGGCLLQINQNIDLWGKVQNYFQMIDLNKSQSKVSVSLVEGVISSQKDIESLRLIRKNSDYLILLGTCAEKGGIFSVGESVSDHIKYDYVISGCPIDTAELSTCLANFYYEKRNVLADSSVCFECKKNSNNCLIKNHKLCLGPVTRGGCNSICLNYGKNCLGCRGIMKSANLLKLEEISPRLEQNELIGYIEK